jgi:uncharacterized protein (UPF0332 family)
MMLDKAPEHLMSADLLHQHGQYRDAVSRAYYASFPAMYALVGAPPRGSWEHPGLRGMFVQQLGARGVAVDTCRRLRQRLRLLHDTRRDADYTTLAIDVTTSQESLAIAREV